MTPAVHDARRIAERRDGTASVLRAHPAAVRLERRAHAALIGACLLALLEAGAALAFDPARGAMDPVVFCRCVGLGLAIALAGRLPSRWPIVPRYALAAGLFFAAMVQLGRLFLTDASLVVALAPLGVFMGWARHPASIRFGPFVALFVAIDGISMHGTMPVLLLTPLTVVAAIVALDVGAARETWRRASDYGGVVLAASRRAELGARLASSANLSAGVLLAVLLVGLVAGSLNRLVTAVAAPGRQETPASPDRRHGRGGGDLTGTAMFASRAERMREVAAESDPSLLPVETGVMSGLYARPRSVDVNATEVFRVRVGPGGARTRSGAWLLRTRALDLATPWGFAAREGRARVLEPMPLSPWAPPFTWDVSAAGSDAPRAPGVPAREGSGRAAWTWMEVRGARLPPDTAWSPAGPIAGVLLAGTSAAVRFHVTPDATARATALFALPGTGHVLGGERAPLDYELAFEARGVASLLDGFPDAEALRAPGTRGRAARVPDAQGAADLLRALPDGIPAIERARAFGRGVTAGAVDDLARVLAVQAELTARFSYERGLASDGAFGEVDEILDRRAGVCAHFALLAATTLRALDVPARPVIGFRVPARPDAPAEASGAADAPAEDEAIVRWEDAHAWIEVPFEGVGFVAFEVTPPSADSAAGANDAAEASLLDELLGALGARSDGRNWMTIGALALGILALVLLLVRTTRAGADGGAAGAERALAAARAWRKRTRDGALFEDLLRDLRACGLDWRAHETAPEFARLASCAWAVRPAPAAAGKDDETDAKVPELARLLAWFERSRFGGIALSDLEVRGVAALRARLRDARAQGRAFSA